MAKPLVVEFQGQTVNLDLSKIDRTKLYGYVDTEVVDESGKVCELATLLGDGRSIVGKGGKALAYLSPEGLWRTKSELSPVDKHGKPITPVRSTFDTVVKLEGRASVEDYLAHNIRLVYQVTPESEHQPLMDALRSGAIFSFPFSYRGGVSASPAFLLQGADGNLFLCVGILTDLEFVGLKATAAVIVEGGEETPEEDDSLEFGMM
jgi:hypothetical protein